MRRPKTLEVDAEAFSTMTPDDSTTSDFARTPESSTNALNIPATTPRAAYSPPAPSIRLLFSLLSRRELVTLVLPAVLLSIIAGGVAPFMTFVVGQVFNVFAQFPLTSNPPQEAKTALLHGVGISALELVGLAVAALALSSFTSCLWIWTGERNTMILRKRIFQSVTGRPMTWFDMKMGADGSVQSSESEGPVGAGGLMAKFARETEEVRMGSSLACGMVVQHLTTAVTCLVLGFDRSWSLTLVILSAVPALMIIQAISQILAGPLVGMERSTTSVAATLVDRAVSAIATVKAFNASTYEVSTLSTVLDKIRLAARKCNAVWGFTSGLSQFTTMAMFVQGFWFGAQLVRKGTIEAGDVMAVFWACLIATSNLQMCIPHFITLAKGKFAMAAMIALIETPTPSDNSSHQPPSPVVGSRRPSAVSFTLPGKKAKSADLRKIVPNKCAGQISIDSVTFAYPSRPTIPVLHDVSLFLPAREMTFIVGGSGSGKSTISQLLLRMYDPQHGTISLDDQDVQYLDSNWTRQQIGAVSQGCILFDMSVHDNVAMGLSGPGSFRRPQDVSREEVVDACTSALMHDFVRNLPDGYDTQLGTAGANLSGGQKQRLAIARAKLRDPSVLILDEATSALDATSRILVFEAIKHWRQNKTTIVITHDLSQITNNDFVYVLKDGHIVEQGYRLDLQQAESGEFSRMMEAQGATGGLPEKQEDPWSEEAQRERDEEAVQIVMEQEQDIEEGMLKSAGARAVQFKHQSVVRPSLGPTTGQWMFEVVADLTGNGTDVMQPALLGARQPDRVSRFIPPEAFGPGSDSFEELPSPTPRRPSTVAIDFPPLPPPALHTSIRRQLSLQFSPVSPTFSKAPSMTTTVVCDDDDSFEDEKFNLEASASAASRRRFYHGERTSSEQRAKPRRDTIHMSTLKEVRVPTEAKPQPAPEPQEVPFRRLVRDIFPTIPNKAGLFLGALFCVISGASTPAFSFMLSKLMVEVSTGATDVSVINTLGGIVLAICAVDGISMGLKFFTLEVVAMNWVTRLRKYCYSLVLAQDKKWFDKSENSSAKIMQVLIKDGDDARSLIATVFGQAIVVTTMLGVGLIWALVNGWQLTLVGFAIAPVFVITMVVQTNLVAKCEYRNKRARETVAKGYYDTILNIRGIRSMGFEKIFSERFNASVESALATGAQGAFVEGCTYGVASSLIYLAEAILFYVSAIFVAKGTYTYLQMVQTLNLIIFSVSIGSQLMAFTQRIAKSINATRDFNKLLQLSTHTAESHGAIRPPIEGAISFTDVTFSYPERPDVPVLKGVNLDIQEGETVAIVGSSGSGKSTIASLLQRLYEPDSGSISIGPWHLGSTEVRHLRDHVSVVSQNPNLFDASITENITYGAAGLPDSDVQRAAMAANVHDFIMSLPQGYSTMLGENAALVSGGQAQRLQIARALARPSKILILDECTSALDGANQAAVLQTIMQAKEGRTTLMVTHKLDVMRMCSRIVVLHEGQIAEEGSYESLMARKGVFAQLANGGEWTGA